MWPLAAARAEGGRHRGRAARLLRGLPLRRDPQRHPRLDGAVQGQQGGARRPGATLRRTGHPPARRHRPDDERRRRHLDPLDDPELALSPLELQDALRDHQALRRGRDPRGLDPGRLAVRLRASSSRATTRSSTATASPARPATSRARSTSKGNIFEGPRRRPYPNPPLRRSGWNDLTAQAAKNIGVHPYPGPDGHPLAGLPRLRGLHLLRLLRLDRLLDRRQGLDQPPLHPAGREDREPARRPAGPGARGQRRQARPRDRRHVPEGRQDRTSSRRRS